MRFTLRWTGSEYRVSEPKIETCEVVTIDEFKQLEAENAKLKAMIQELLNECSTAKRELLPQADPTGDARLAYGIVADRLAEILSSTIREDKP